MALRNGSDSDYGQHVEPRTVSAAPLASVELAKFPNPQ
jgi:hypothetical protein